MLTIRRACCKPEVPQLPRTLQHAEVLKSVRVDSRDQLERLSTNTVALDEIKGDESMTDRKRGLDITISHMKTRGKRNVFNKRGSYFLKFSWGSVEQSTNKTKAFRQSCSWENNVLRFEYNSATNVSTSDDLRVEFFAEEDSLLFKKRTKLLGAFSLPVSRIVNAPIHHSYNLRAEGIVVSYNLRITEVAHWTLRLKDITFRYKSNSKLSEEDDNQQRSFQLGYSLNVHHGSEKMLFSDPLRTRLKTPKSKLSAAVDEATVAFGPKKDKKGDKWEKVRTTVRETFYPEANEYRGKFDALKPLQKFGTFRSIISGTVHLQLFKLLDNVAETVNNRVLVGECWLSVDRLYGKASDETSASRFDAVEMWNLGKVRGKVSGAYEFTPMPTQRQSSGGVLTEEGVSILTRTVLKSDPHRLEVKSISPYHKQLSQAVEAFVCQFQRQSNDYSARTPDNLLQQKNQQYKHCMELLRTLCTSEKETVVSFFYETQSSMLKVADILIRLWMVLVDWIDAVQVGVKAWFYKLIYAVLRRAELSSMMCEALKDAKKKKGMSSRVKNEIFDISLSIRGLLFRTLAWVLNKLNLNPRYDELRTFSSQVVAIMFVRIPRFGSLMQEHIVQRSRGLQTTSYIQPSQNVIDYIDQAWIEFHESLEDHFGDSEDLKSQEQLIPEKITWFKEISKHRGIFYDFCQQLIVHMLDTVSSLATTAPEYSSGTGFTTGIQWNYIPAYQTLLQVFVTDLELISVQSIPEAMLRLSMLLLVEPKNLTIFTNILLHKCSMHNIGDVVSTLDIISSWIIGCASWPGRFQANSILRRYGPFLAPGAKVVLDPTKGEVLTRVTKGVAADKSAEAALLAEALQSDCALSFTHAWDFSRACLYMPVQELLTRGDSWQKELFKVAPPFLPRTFDFNSLFQALWILLHSDRFQVVQRTLQFVYNMWDAFPPDFRGRARCMFLICSDDPLALTRQVYDISSHLKAQEFKALFNGNFEDEVPLFVKLFFHWSKQVRNFFHILLVHKLTKTRGKDATMERLNAAMRVAMHSSEPTLFARIWGNTPRSKEENLRLGVDVTKALTRRMLVRQEDVKAKRRVLRRKSATNITAATGNRRRTRSMTMDEVNDIYDAVQEIPPVKSEQSPRSPVVSGYELINLEDDMAMCAWKQWPEYISHYSFIAVEEFKEIYESAPLQPDIPELDSHVVVEENGEMVFFGATKKLAESRRRARNKPLY